MNRVAVIVIASLASLAGGLFLSWFSQVVALLVQIFLIGLLLTSLLTLPHQRCKHGHFKKYQVPNTILLLLLMVFYFSQTSGAVALRVPEEMISIVISATLGVMGAIASYKRHVAWRWSCAEGEIAERFGLLAAATAFFLTGMLISNLINNPYGLL